MQSWLSVDLCVVDLELQLTHFRYTVLCTIRIELSEHKLFDKSKNNSRFCLAVSLVHVGDPAMFAIVQEPQVSLYQGSSVHLTRDISVRCVTNLIMPSWHD